MQACPVCHAEQLAPAPDRDGLGPTCSRLLAWFREGIARDFGEKSAAWVTHETTFQDLSTESLDRLEWLAEAEERFGAAIGDLEAEALRTVGDFLRSIRADARKPIEP